MNQTVKIPPPSSEMIAYIVGQNPVTGKYVYATQTGELIQADEVQSHDRSLLAEMRLLTTTQKLDLIISKVAEGTGVSVSAIRHKGRKKEAVVLRQLFCYIAAKLAICSLKAIGGYLNNRDHTTVIYSRDTFHDLYTTGDNLAVSHFQRMVDKYPGLTVYTPVKALKGKK